MGIHGDGARLKTPSGEVIHDPMLWERFIGADIPGVPWIGCFCTLAVTILFAVLGISMFSMSDAFGGFVLNDELTQAFLAHGEHLDGRTYFTDEEKADDELVSRRTWSAALATIFLEVKDTKCPGDDCDVKSKNAITAKYLGYIKKIEEKIWSDRTFQEKYCALIEKDKPGCKPPYSPLSLMLWGDGVAPEQKSKELVAEGYGHAGSCESWPRKCQPNCVTWASPLDEFERTKCSSPAWSHVINGSGAAAPGDLASYAEVIDKICTPNPFWEDLSLKFFPNFACDDNHMKNHGVPFIRSQLLFGIPFDRDMKADDIDMQEQMEDLADDYGSDFFELYEKTVNDIMEEDDTVNVVVFSVVSQTASRDKLQNETLSLTAVSFLLVFLYMWFNVESFFLACMGMLQVLFSVFPTVVIWDAFINQQGVQFLQLIGVFMIIGIGADTIFVLNDSFKQVKVELHDVEGIKPIHMFSVAYRRAMSAMLATTSTTSLAFFFGIFNPIPVIADFCIFACIIVFINFLLCISLGAACLAFQDRFMAGHLCFCCGGTPAPGRCGAPGCCFGATRMAFRKFRGIEPDATTEARALEVFFAGPLYRFLKRFKYAFIVFWVAILIAAGVSAALGVEIADKDPEGLPEDHPEQRFQTLRNEYFVAPEPEVVRVLWGLDSDGPVSEWSDTEGNTPKKIEFMDIGAALSPSGQNRILNLCRAPDTEAGTLRCMDKGCLVKGSSTPCEYGIEDGYIYTKDPLCQSGRYCIMEQVKQYADLNGLEFPLADFHGVVSDSNFHDFMKNYWRELEDQKQHWHKLNYKENTGLVIEGGRVTYMWVSFNATFEGRFLPPAEGNQVHDDWEDFITRYADGTNFFQVHIMFLFKVLQDVIVEEAFKSIGCSLAVALAVLAMVTWNWFLAVLGIFNLVSILICFLGMWPILGWQLDIFNVIFCIMSVGLSVDYTVHMVHAYNDGGGRPDREGRVQHALSAMGITVVSGALTTLFAALPLLFTVPVFYSRFGSFVFICITLSILTSIFFLVPVLLVIGPAGTFGDIKPLYMLQAKIFPPKPDKMDTMERSLDKMETSEMKQAVVSVESSNGNGNGNGHHANGAPRAISALEAVKIHQKFANVGNNPCKQVGFTVMRV